MNALLHAICTYFYLLGFKERNKPGCACFCGSYLKTIHTTTIDVASWNSKSYQREEVTLGDLASHPPPLPSTSVFRELNP
jgi:hypothetical protein